MGHIPELGGIRSETASVCPLVVKPKTRSIGAVAPVQPSGGENTVSSIVPRALYGLEHLQTSPTATFDQEGAFHGHLLEVCELLWVGGPCWGAVLALPIIILLLR